MLTGKQMKIYRFIRKCILLEGRSPTYRRIASVAGIVNSYPMVTSICKRGWLQRQSRRITLGGPAPSITSEFDYLVVDYENLTTTGWPRLIGIDD